MPDSKTVADILSEHSMSWGTNRQYRDGIRCRNTECRWFRSFDDVPLLADAIHAHSEHVEEELRKLFTISEAER